MRDKELHFKLAKDVRQNGSMYIKNRNTVQALIDIDQNFSATYDQEDQMYLVTYRKVMPDVVYKR